MATYKDLKALIADIEAVYAADEGLSLYQRRNKTYAIRVSRALEIYKDAEYQTWKENAEAAVKQYMGGEPSLDAYAGWRERADRPAWCTQTGQMVHGGRSRGAHDRHAGLLYSVIPLRLRMESPSTRIE